MRPLKPCGTRAAYQRHLAHREVPCEACTEANRLAVQNYAKAPERRAAVLDEVAAQTIWHGRRSA
jgi:hypothetical protein